MFEKVRQALKRRDDGVSPVIGTILMVAVTVVLAGTVFVAVSGFGNKSVSEPSNAAFKVQVLDTNGNGKTDRIKITYLTGPTDVSLSDVKVNITSGSGSFMTLSKADTWDPGEFAVVDPSAAGAWFVSVAMYGTTLVDQVVTVNE